MNLKSVKTNRKEKKKGLRVKGEFALTEKKKKEKMQMKLKGTVGKKRRGKEKRSQSGKAAPTGGSTHKEGLISRHASKKKGKKGGGRGGRNRQSGASASRGIRVKYMGDQPLVLQWKGGSQHGNESRPFGGTLPTRGKGEWQPN